MSWSPPKAFIFYFVPGWRHGAVSSVPLSRDFPWALQLKEQILKEQITDGRVFSRCHYVRVLLVAVVSCPWMMDTIVFLQCLGLSNTLKTHCGWLMRLLGHMSMTLLQSRLSFLKGLGPFCRHPSGLSGSSRGPPAGALGDLRVTVRAVSTGPRPHGCSNSSYSKRPVRFPGGFRWFVPQGGQHFIRCAARGQYVDSKTIFRWVSAPKLH